MSKVDAQRAMKEARYAALEAQASAARSTAARTSAPAPARTSAPAAGSPAVATVAARTPRPRPRGADAAAPAESGVVGTDPEAICGHRSIGNKACQRPAGHTEKNHRYK